MRNSRKKMKEIGRMMMKMKMKMTKMMAKKKKKIINLWH